VKVNMWLCSGTLSRNVCQSHAWFDCEI